MVHHRKLTQEVDAIFSKMRRSESTLTILFVVVAALCGVCALLILARKLIFKIKVSIQVRRGLQRSATMVDYFQNPEHRIDILPGEVQQIKESRGYGENQEELDNKLRQIADEKWRAACEHHEVELEVRKERQDIKKEKIWRRKNGLSSSSSEGEKVVSLAPP